MGFFSVLFSSGGFFSRLFSGLLSGDAPEDRNSESPMFGPQSQSSGFELFDARMLARIASQLQRGRLGRRTTRRRSRAQIAADLARILRAAGRQL